MAYDEGLAQRIRETLEDLPGVSEKKMFGGLCFLVGGNMACGVVAEELMVRVGPKAYEELLALPHAREMDFTGRALRGMLYVGTDGIEADADLDAWVARGADFAGSLAAKGGAGPGGRTAKKTKKAKKAPAKPQQKKTAKTATRKTAKPRGKTTGRKPRA